MTRAQALAVLAQAKPELVRRFGVVRLGPELRSHIERELVDV